MQSLPIKKLERIQGLETGQQWLIHATGPGSAPCNIKNNSLQIGWPNMSQVIYPGQTGRINTGVVSTQMGTGTSLMTLPQKTLLQNGLMSNPQIIDASDPRNGTQMVQLIQNTNKFPVKIEYQSTSIQYAPEQELPGPRITRLDPETLQQVELLQDFDWGALINGIVQVGVKIIPLLI